MQLADLSRLGVADLEHGNADAVEDAVIAAWKLQSGK